MVADGVKPCIERYQEVVGGGLSICANPDPMTLPLPPKFGSKKTPPSNYGQTVADGQNFKMNGTVKS